MNNAQFQLESKNLFEVCLFRKNNAFIVTLHNVSHFVVILLQRATEQIGRAVQRQ